MIHGKNLKIFSATAILWNPEGAQSVHSGCNKPLFKLLLS